MIETVIRCDECQEEKKTTNHWWLIISLPLTTEGFRLSTGPSIVAQYAVGNFDENTARVRGVHAYCGTEHFQKALLRGLTTGSLDSPTSRKPLIDLSDYSKLIDEEKLTTQGDGSL
jgi:hypothetical protein